MTERRGKWLFWWRSGAIVAVLASVLLAGVIVTSTGETVVAQQSQPAPRRGKQVPVAPLPQVTPTPPKAGDPRAPEPRTTTDSDENVQADVSTRTVAVTSSFTGTEIVVFGAIDNSRQPSPEAGIYDVVIIIEGAPGRITVRKKGRVGGIWLNREAQVFESVPSYYAIASTRPLDEVAPEATLIGYELGFDHVRMVPVGRTRLPPADMRAFREAVVRIKKEQGLYVSQTLGGVGFVGKSLFRANIELPATVSVGPFDTRVYLFRGERLISQYNVRINLEREGLERFLHDSAFDYPFLYGLATVLLALASGLIASALFSKSAH